MRKQLGYLTSLLFLCATAFAWVGCSDNCCREPQCDQPSTMCAPQRPVCAPEQEYNAEPEYAQQQACAPQQQDCAPQPACAPQPRPVCAPQPRPVCAPQPRPVCPPQPACAPQPRPACAPQPACPPVCAPVCKPCAPPPCEPQCKILKPCDHPSKNELVCKDGIRVFARNPTMCMLGDQYPLEFEIDACDDVCDAVVTAHLPEGVTFVRSTPEAKVEGRKLTWFIGSMSRGERICAKVWLKCECEGELCACFCASATPVRFCSLLCAKPVLVCEKCGPEEVCPGDCVKYTITVSNRGSCAAEDVVLTDNIPDGLSHSTCMRTLTYKLGTLQPCETKKVHIDLVAEKRGKVTNTAVVTACNADSTSCQWTTCVCCCALECFKCGPKEQQVGKNADYQITVVNTGDKPLTDVVVTDNAPSSTSIVAANGATINGNQAVWRLRELKPGEKVSFTLTLTTCTPGCFTNKVYVSNCQGCCGSCEFTTRWRGNPALGMCVETTENPICVGETTSYNISVVNQGSEADTNVVISASFPEGLQPIGVAGDYQGEISGQNVKFGPIPNVAARQTIRLRVDATAKTSGDKRLNFSVSSDNKKPVNEEESTIVN